eukprot:1002672-Pelagomonas_calceolata.AAC.2
MAPGDHDDLACTQSFCVLQDPSYHQLMRDSLAPSDHENCVCMQNFHVFRDSSFMHKPHSHRTQRHQSNRPLCPDKHPTGFLALGSGIDVHAQAGLTQDTMAPGDHDDLAPGGAHAHQLAHKLPAGQHSGVLSQCTSHAAMSRTPCKLSMPSLKHIQANAIEPCQGCRAACPLKRLQWPWANKLWYERLKDVSTCQA